MGSSTYFPDDRVWSDMSGTSQLQRGVSSPPSRSEHVFTDQMGRVNPALHAVHAEPQYPLGLDSPV